MPKEGKEMKNETILYFPEFVAKGKGGKFHSSMVSSMEPKILEYILEYAKMEADPRSMELHDHFDRETVSIARAIICRHKELTTPSEGDNLALLWAKRKMGVREDVCVPD